MSFFSKVDWGALLSGAVLGVLGVGIRAVIQAPVKALTEHSWGIRLFSFLSPQKPFSEKWIVTWRVRSRRFHDQNSDCVKISRLFSNITFTTTATLKDGTHEKCVFVGKLVDRTITGRWFNPADEELGYFGTFQVQLHAGLRIARGSWVGWSNDGSIQANELEIKRSI